MDAFFAASVWNFMWGLIGAVGTVVTLGVIIRNALYPSRGLGRISLWFRQNNRLVSLLSEEDRKAGRKPFIHIVEIQDYGREVIDVEEYIKPLQLRYGNNARIVGFNVIKDKHFVEPRIYEVENEPGSIQMVELLQLPCRRSGEPPRRFWTLREGCPQHGHTPPASLLRNLKWIVLGSDSSSTVAMSSFVSAKKTSGNTYVATW